MKRLYVGCAALGVLLVALSMVGWSSLSVRPGLVAASPEPSTSYVGHNDDPRPLPDFVKKGLDWLARMQFENGGWGAGAHARQDVRDPRAVQVDPATTAFAATAFLRSGNTLTEGAYRDNVRKAVAYLLDLVEAAPEDGVRISDATGTQPQVKLGEHIDLAMTVQLFTQVLPHTEHDAALRGRVANALETCVTKLTRAQDADGSWNSRGGWAGVLQSAMANSALEMAEVQGVAVDQAVLERSRRYQKDNLDEASGAVRTESAAGIALYSIASNQRATSKEAREAEQKIAEGLQAGHLDLAPATPLEEAVSEDNLRKLGYDDDDAQRLAEAYRKNKAASRMMQDDDVLSGFGNNGGEEYLSYMMTSESLAADNGEEWDAWYQKMYGRLGKIQNADGSWSGHHCITSPVFCTAAVILTMTADRAGRV